MLLAMPGVKEMRLAFILDVCVGTLESELISSCTGV